MDRFRLQAALSTAVDNDELFLEYQPQLEISTGQMIGVEALIRWRHPEFGVVRPDRFIGLAEQNGLIVGIGEWALRTACGQNMAWRAAGLPPIRVAVNVSARQFRSPDFPKKVAAILEEAGHPPGDLELELTESMLMHDVRTAVELMNALVATGVALSIDDFGTGYSSLAALKTFPIRRLKLDRAFVQNIASDEQDQAIASAVITLGHRMRFSVIAEGIETEEQLAFLSDQGCDEMQGFLFSRPVHPREIAQLLSTSNGHLRRETLASKILDRFSVGRTSPTPL